MKKWGIIYLSFTFIVLIVLAALNLFSGNFEQKTFFFLLLGIIGLLCIFLFQNNLYNILALKTLMIICFFQIFIFKGLGYDYKFIFGTDFTFYFKNVNGVQLEFKFKFFNASIHFYELTNNNDFILGINIFHFVTFILLSRLLNCSDITKHST